MFGWTVIIEKENSDTKIPLRTAASKRFLNKRNYRSSYYFDGHKVEIIKDLIQFHIDKLGDRPHLKEAKDFCDSYFLNT